MNPATAPDIMPTKFQPMPRMTLPGFSSGRFVREETTLFNWWRGGVGSDWMEATGLGRWSFVLVFGAFPPFIDGEVDCMYLDETPTTASSAAVCGQRNLFNLNKL